MTRGKCKEVLQALWRYKDCGYSENEIRESLDMAIKALEKEPCEDCVSREQLKRELHAQMAVNAMTKETAEDMLNHLPSVTPTRKEWIPVSERLPENAFGCLVTVEEDDIYGEPQRVIYPEFVGYDGETWNDASGKQIAFEVIAWMPLPKPFNAERR